LTPGPNQAGAGTLNNSITVLLPDGQLVLYECFTANDCARGFRVPSLFHTPEPLAWGMLARIREGLAGDRDLSADAASPPHSRLPRDEAVAALGPDSRIHIEGLASRLSNGHYTYDVRPLDRSHTREFHLPIEKDGPSVTLTLPSFGLYFVIITDSLNSPRIDLFIAAVEPSKAASFQKSYRDTAALMKEWNEYYLGWPVHDFQRAYLESLILGKNAALDDARRSAGGKPASDRRAPGAVSEPAADQGAGVTAEPAFSPKPGIYDNDIAITLKGRTPGATMHFTLDGSQPVASSSVYHAPIMVKGTELTIKAFATVTGRKDSPVITGIFRVRE
jgi:hypothetical protein